MGKWKLQPGITRLNNVAWVNLQLADEVTIIEGWIKMDCLDTRRNSNGEIWGSTNASWEFRFNKNMQPLDAIP